MAPGERTGGESSDEPPALTSWRERTCMPGIHEIFVFVACLFVVGTVYTLFIPRFSFILLYPERFTVGYDSLGKHLLAGEAHVDPESISWEGFRVNGKVYMYQGPFPAILRICLNALYPQGYGQWSRVSMLLAGLVLIVSACALWSAATPASSVKRNIHCLYEFFFVIGICLGTPALYLMANAWIYHESIIWGLALSTAVSAIGFRILLHRSPLGANLFIGSLLAGAALLTRVSFGASGMLVMLGCAVFATVERGGLFSREWLRTGLLLSPFGICGILQLWYNYARFGSIFTFCDFSGSYIHPELIGGITNPARITESLRNYLGYKADSIGASWPFLRLGQTVYRRPEIFFYYREGTTSLLMCSPWLIIGGFAGVLIAWKRRMWAHLAMSGSFTPQLFLILTFYFLTQRYACDILPIFLWLAGPLVAWCTVTRLRNVIITLVLPVCISIFTTLCVTVSWISSDAQFIPEVQSIARMLVGASEGWLRR